MKKFSFLLIALSFLFAAAALAIAIMGYVRPRTVAIDLAPPSIPFEEIVPAPEDIILEENPYKPNPDQTPVSVTPEELGFRISPPDSFGEFVLTFNPGPWVGSGTYQGKFSKEPGVTFTVTSPEFVEGREGYYADIQGYIKGEDGRYEGSFIGGNRDWIPADIIVGEVELKDGVALILKGKNYDGPSWYPSTPGQRLAIIGTPAGKVSAALFLAEPTVSAERFRSLLQTISVIDPQSLNN